MDGWMDGTGVTGRDRIRKSGPLLRSNHQDAVRQSKKHLSLSPSSTSCGRSTKKSFQRASFGCGGGPKDKGGRSFLIGFFILRGFQLSATLIALYTPLLIIGNSMVGFFLGIVGLESVKGGRQSVSSERRVV